MFELSYRPLIFGLINRKLGFYSEMFPYPPQSVRVPSVISNAPYFPPLLLRHAAFPSPLDLSVRTSIPITPPTTPSPPRKRSHPDENDQRGEVLPENQWRHRVGYFDDGSVNPMPMFWKWTQMENVQDNSNHSVANLPLGVRRQSMEGPKNFGYFDCKIMESKNGTSPEMEMNNAKCSNVTDHDSDSDSDEDEFVDVLTQDDDNELPEQIMCSANSETSDSVIEVLAGDLADGDDERRKDCEFVSPLNRNETVYDDEQLHSAAIEGFAKLFEQSVAAKETKLIKPLPLPQTEPEQVPKPERKKTKLKKQIHFDDDNTSPVSGTIIRKLRDDEELVVRKGDIDPAFNVVEITDEAKEVISKIDNRIGEYLCQLCRTLYDDAFQLAQHRCSRIVHIEYRCAECDKVFNCPANLASHKRWHKPRPNCALNKGRFQVPPSENSDRNIESNPVSSNGETDLSGTGFPCNDCGKVFRRLVDRCELNVRSERIFKKIF